MFKKKKFHEQSVNCGHLFWITEVMKNGRVIFGANFDSQKIHRWICDACSGLPDELVKLANWSDKF